MNPFDVKTYLVSRLKQTLPRRRSDGRGHPSVPADVRGMAFVILLHSLGLGTVVGQVAPPVWHDADQRTASGTDTSLSVARPSNLSAGDLVILLMTQQRSPVSSGSAFTTPTGFTRIRSEHDTSQTDVPEVTAFYKIATASEPTSYTSTASDFGGGANPQWKAVAARVTGHEPQNPIGSHSGVNSGSNSVPGITIPELATSVKNSLLVAARSVRRSVSGENVPTGMDLEWSLAGSGTSDDKRNPPAFRGASEIRPSAGPTGTRLFSWSESARAAGLMFTINRLTPLADLQMAMTLSNAEPLPGQQVTFTLRVTNNGPNDATGVKVNHKLPAGYTYLSDTGLLAYNPSTGVWTVGNLPKGGSVSLGIVALVNVSGDFTAIATVEGNEDDPVLFNNKARIGIYPSDVSVTKTVDIENPRPGDQVTFTIGIRNHGPSNAANIRVTDQLPSGYEFVSAQPSTGTWSDPVWTVPTLANGATATLLIRATVIVRGAYLNIAAVNANSFDPDLGNNEANAGITNPNLPKVNGIFHGDGDYERYVLIATSARGSRLYGYFDPESSRYYIALVVNRSVNDNVVGPGAYTSSAGWTPAHPFNKLVDSEFMGFTLSCGSQTWTWQQGYGAQPNSLRNVTSPTWFSSHQAGAGSGTPPPGYVSSSSMVWNLNNHARGGSPSWDVSAGGTLPYNEWKSPSLPGFPNDVTKVDGYPATGEITHSNVHGWEWAMVYEFSVDLSSAGPNPIRLSNIGSHHSPAKTSGEDDPILLGGPLFDWGDLPAPYPTTMAQAGPRHELVSQGAFLGTIRPDLDPDGQPHPEARGDDLSGITDEDGITFLSPVSPNHPVYVRVVAGTAGNLSGWIDFKGNGVLTQVNVLSSTGPAAVTPGLLGDTRLAQPGNYVLRIEVPPNATGRMFSRWRFTNQAGQGGNSITDYASTGEVEDHALASIGDLVWRDNNGNGLQDANEPGLDGVLVELLLADGTPVVGGNGNPVTDTTALGGRYGFSGLPTGVPYMIRFSRPSGLVFSRLDADRQGINGALNSDVNPLTGRTTAFTLSIGENNPNIDAGLTLPSALGDFVWEDKNGNGIQDDAASGIGGVSAKLHWVGYGPDAIPGTADDDEAIATTVSNAQGFYGFSNLIPGNYKVVFGAPSGYLHTARARGTDPALDSDVYPATGETAIISLSEGQNNLTVDAGLLRHASIGDRVWLDANANGIQDAGEVGLGGLTVSLEGTDGVNQSVSRTTTTSAQGFYQFTSLLPGNYTVTFGGLPPYVFSPQGTGGNTSLDSDADPLTGRTSMIAIASGQTNADIDAGLFQFGSISGSVLVDTNRDSLGDTPLGDVLLTLVDASGNPVLGGSGTPKTSITTPEGIYGFANLAPGTYGVKETQPFGYNSLSDKDGGDPDEIRPITVTAGNANTGNDFIEMQDNCPDNWAEWKFQHPGETAGGNPDSDAYDNFAEFAFAMPHDSGVGSKWLERQTAWIIRPSVIAPGTVEGVFIRPKGAPENVTYVLQSAPLIGNPTQWQDLVITPDIFTAVDNGDCTETITVHDLAGLTGNNGGTGVVRIKAVLDDNGNNDGDIDHTSYTETEGWTETILGICCQTYSVPYLRETVFTGTVGQVTGQDLVFPSDILDNLLTTGVAYQLEVTSGADAGQRFDVVFTAGNRVSLTSDTDIHDAFAPFNTMAGTPPTSLLGSTVVIRPHWTLDGLFTRSGFVAGNSQANADQVQTYAGGAWTTYWLYDMGDADAATSRWVRVADDPMSDQGGVVIPPGQGMFVIKRNNAVTLLSCGEIRTNDFIRPLRPGIESNLVGAGYPLDQAFRGTGSRQMNLAAAPTPGFFGSRDFKTADTVLLWKADATAVGTGYDTYYLLSNASPPALKWVKVGDAALLGRDSEVLFKKNRAVFVRSKNAYPNHRITAPWTP